MHDCVPAEYKRMVVDARDGGRSRSTDMREAS